LEAATYVTHAAILCSFLQSATIDKDEQASAAKLAHEMEALALVFAVCAFGDGDFLIFILV
jgi:hypothetical protein